MDREKEIKAKERRLTLEDTRGIRSMLIYGRYKSVEIYDYEKMVFELFNNGVKAADGIDSITYKVSIRTKNDNRTKTYMLTCICLEIGVHGNRAGICKMFEDSYTYGVCAYEGGLGLEYFNHEMACVNNYVFSFILTGEFTATFDSLVDNDEGNMTDEYFYGTFIPECLETLLDFLDKFECGGNHIYYCDVKPFNIVNISKDKNVLDLKIVDFAYGNFFDERYIYPHLSAEDKQAYDLLMVLQFLIVTKNLGCLEIVNFKHLDDYVAGDLFEKDCGNPLAKWYCPSNTILGYIWGPDGFFYRDTVFNKYVRANFLKYICNYRLNKRLNIKLKDSDDKKTYTFTSLYTKNVGERPRYTDADYENCDQLDLHKNFILSYLGFQDPYDLPFGG